MKANSPLQPPTKVTLCSPVLKYGFSQHHCRVCDRDLSFLPRRLRVCPGRKAVAENNVATSEGDSSHGIKIQVHVASEVAEPSDASEDSSLSGGDTSDEGDDGTQGTRSMIKPPVVATAEPLAAIP